MSKKLLALIKWVGGNDDRKYTVGIPVEWIKSFDYEEYLLSTEDNTYVIEWRASAKEPLGGWDCYDGYVIEVSDRLNFLKQKMMQIDGVPSPTRVFKSAAEPSTVSSAVTPGENATPNANDGQKPSGSGANSQIGSIQSNQVGKDQAVGAAKKKLGGDKKALTKKNDPHVQTNRRLDTADSFESKQGSEDGDESGIVEINSQSNLVAQMIKGQQKIGAQLAKVCDVLKRQGRKQSRCDDASDSDSDEEEPTVRIGPKNSGVRVTFSQWRTAKSQGSYTAMGVSLMMALFPMEVLLRSNLRGGARKISREQNAERFNALDKKICAAIYYAVETYHPKTFRASGLGIALNNKLSSLRRAEKNRTAEAEVQQDPPNPA